MKSGKNISGQAPGGKRTNLADALPLDTPYVVQIFPIYACTFQCRYCIFSIDKEKRGFISDQVVMSLDLYKKSIDEMSRFPQKIKVLRFVGIGEPLLHKDIVEMVEYAVEKKVANTVEILTNGLRLTNLLSDALIKAGLSRLVVSLQGTSAEKYKKVCGVEIDFDQFVRNIKYFHQKKTTTQVYLKIIDCALDGKDDEVLFCKIFENLCDSFAIEHTVPIHSGIDYNKLLDKEKIELTQFGLPVGQANICPQPFFTMQINPDGKVVPCYSFEYPMIMGDCNHQSLHEIWTGNKFQQFRLNMLDGVHNASQSCADCKIFKFRLFPEDDLTAHANQLKAIYRRTNLPDPLPKS